VPSYRLDFAYPRRRVAVEYNGYDAHEMTAEQRASDAARLEWLQRNGWTVIVIRRGDFSGDGLDRWLNALADALAPQYTPLRKLERGAVRG
jgi:very-short-patch-repair endonuclease